MSSRTGSPPMRSAAWRISLWATLAFACGTIVVFIFLQSFMAGDIQRRSDAWLSGEVEVLGDVAERTPKDALYDRVVGEVAELAAREVPNKLPNESGTERFGVLSAIGQRRLAQVMGGRRQRRGPFEGDQCHQNSQRTIQPIVHVPGFSVPFRVASLRIDDGSHIFLGLVGAG